MPKKTGLAPPSATALRELADLVGIGPLVGAEVEVDEDWWPVVAAAAVRLIKDQRRRLARADALWDELDSMFKS
jgi:hypothetical protein